MEIQLQTPKTVLVREPESVTFSTIEIERILDDPQAKKVIVWIKGLGYPVELGDLSGDYYDNPEWTNLLVEESVKKFISALPENLPASAGGEAA